jgi:uncharacterized membrane protein
MERRVKMSKAFTAPLEKISFKLIRWVGTPVSVIFHTLLFILVPLLALMGFFDARTVLLIFTTWLSVEAIYLAIFIQMSVNRNTESLEEVEEDIEDIQEDTSSEEEANRVILHIGKEVRQIQHDLDVLRKSGILKSVSNGNHKKIHA